MSDQGQLIPISDEQAKAIQEASKAAQEAIKALQGVGGFLREAFGTVPEDVVALLGGNWLRVKRLENLIVTLHKMQERLGKRGIKPEQVSLSRALPILIAAADESIDELQELWARLLAAAADPARVKSFRLQFIEAAKQMDPLDAAVLQSAEKTEGAHKRAGRVKQSDQNEVAEQLSVRKDQVEVSLRNLTRLNLIDHPTHADFFVSAFGREFLRAISD